MWIGSIIIPLLATCITLLTAYWQPYSVYEYGFPLEWKSLSWIGCVPCVVGGQCCSPTMYNWLFFLLDTAFYSVLGYPILIGYVIVVKRARRTPVL